MVGSEIDGTYHIKPWMCMERDKLKPRQINVSTALMVRVKPPAWNPRPSNPMEASLTKLAVAGAVTLGFASLLAFLSYIRPAPFPSNAPRVARGLPIVSYTQVLLRFLSDC